MKNYNAIRVRLAKAADFGPRLPWYALVMMTGLVVVMVVRAVVWPAYHDRQSRMYTSRLGLVSTARRRNQPLPVVIGFPQTQSITEHFVGEGFVRSTPILVPIIPASRIQRVFVAEGDHVCRGQSLAQLDTSHAELRVEAARVVLEVAEAELERTKIGSSYLLEKERPEKDAIRVHAAEEQIRIRHELAEMYQTLFEERAISKADLLRRKLQTIQTLAELQEAHVALNQSQQGRAQSIRIAAAAVREAGLALRQRELELQDHEILAPADGTIERRLIQEGEYNQDPGRPAFLLASGRWFEGYFDQTLIGKISVGDETRVSLEAFAGAEIHGTVSAIHPFVSFSSGGPETSRPIRPSGTGAPEWPSTFSVRVELHPTELPVSTGLSGLVRITRIRDVLAVPTGALLAKTAATGFVLVTDGQEFKRRKVVLGASSDGWTEIRQGLDAAERIIVEGQHDLLPGDKIRVEADEISLAKQE